ncbi:MAG: family 43 glycosylhydrolase [Candidatus Symbiothrix sp.]|nr:family 43 glycosylhydrolase [Candidatus Symbiothrix sp.]
MKTYCNIFISALVLLTACPAATFAQDNPFIKHMYTADPSAHVWEDGRLYVYASHDVAPPRGCDLMDEYHVFSTGDMVNWTDHGEILRASQVPWGKPLKNDGKFMWAPDCAYKNGTYYFFFPHPSEDPWNQTWKIGVATSKKPASDFKVIGYIKNAEALIDPCVFVDDDGQVYFYQGGGGVCKGGKLKDNMLEIDGELKVMEGPEDFHEATWVHKRNGVYYLSYSDNHDEKNDKEGVRGDNRMRYATGKSPLGPWKYQGIYMDPTDSYTNHGSIVEYKGQWYAFYHNSQLSRKNGEPNDWLRSVCVDKLYYNPDGTIQKVIQTDGKLRVGTAKINITPQKPKYPVHDSIFARSLILDAKGVRIAFVSLDLGGYTNIPLAETLKKKFHLNEIYFSPQHTHSSERAPDEWLNKQLITVMEQASNDMFEATLSAGYRYFPQLSFNRLILREDGRARESWVGDEHYRAVNPERIPHGPVDPAVGILKFDDTKGKTRAVIMNYACHPDVAWNNFEISGDYVGYAVKYTEEAFDNSLNCLFVQGGGGNQAPLFKDGGRKDPDDPRPSNYDLIDRMGKLLSIEAVKLTKELYPNPHDKADIKVKADSLSFTGRYDKKLNYNVHFSVISINNRYVIATVPGEPFIKFQIDWKRELQPYGLVPFLFGYTWNGGQWPVYLPDIRSAAYGGYGADNGPGLIEVGAGEKIMLKQLENYYVINGIFK